jgi:hypothetical protein
VEAACPFLGVAESLTSLHVHDRENVISSNVWMQFFTALRTPARSLKVCIHLVSHCYVFVLGILMCFFPEWSGVVCFYFPPPWFKM